jgi:hypothetical protein
MSSNERVCNSVFTNKKLPSHAGTRVKVTPVVPPNLPHLAATCTNSHWFSGDWLFP